MVEIGDKERHGMSRQEAGRIGGRRSYNETQKLRALQRRLSRGESFYEPVGDGKIK